LRQDRPLEAGVAAVGGAGDTHMPIIPPAPAKYSRVLLPVGAEFAYTPSAPQRRAVEVTVRSRPLAVNILRKQAGVLC
jgi:hypothetical protein